MFRSPLLRATGLLALLCLPARAQVPPDAEIRRILAERIDTFHMGMGIVVGVTGPEGRRIVAHGRMDKGDPRPLTGRTVFEIGSVTKVFTSLLLADMVQRGEVALTDPVARFLPAGVRVPQRDGRSITLEDLATQTSGLPRLPGNLAPRDLANPYADYTPELLFQFLDGYTLPRAIGAQYEYSNLGVGLLGQALARRAGVDYETLVRTRVAQPLGMASTAITLTPDLKSRLAPGHDRTLAPAPNWDLPTLAGAGALRSDADDLLTFLEASAGLARTSLAPALAAMLAPRRPTPLPRTEIALGWHITRQDDGEVVWHNGGTGGYRAYLGFNPRTRAGVVVLANAADDIGIDDLGRHLLDPRQPLAKPPAEHREAAVDAKVLDECTGDYELAPGFILTVTRQGAGLQAQATGQPALPIFPEGGRAFFYKAVNAQLTFEPAVDGKAPGLVLHQNGRDMLARRRTGPAPAVPEAVAVSPEVLRTYVGSYALSPAFILTITQEGARLFAQATGQPRIEIFAKGPREFFYKVVDARITFEADAQGQVRNLVLHQNGARIPGRRLE